MSTWRPLLRLAWRDAARARARSLLVLVMIALPVLAVTAADVVIHTSAVSPREGIDRRLGSAQAQVIASFDGSPTYQVADPENGGYATDGTGTGRPTRLGDVSQVLGRQVPSLERREGSVRVGTDKGVAEIEANELDLRDPLASGLFRTVSGRLPQSADEVVVTQAVADRGPGLGEQLEIEGGDSLSVVGIVESSSSRDIEVAVGLSGAFGLDLSGRSWLIGGPPVTWGQVMDLNQIGVLVLSRAVIEHPPTESELPPQLQGVSGGGPSQSTIAVVVLIVVMALLEVVLLAGPAFAVGARRQSRTLALMAASGGTPRQSRGVVLASGLVLGGLAAVAGVLLGIGAGWALLPVAQRFSGTWFGPFQVPWLHLVGIAAFGLLSAFLAAIVPAWIASRQDIVAVLAGRRGDRAPSMRSPLLGVLLLGAGVAGSAVGALHGSGEILIAASAVVAVVGMILVVPVVLAAIARVSRRLPLVLRYAVRDAARHRTRTVPAVAAVAATVAGVVALGIANASDAEQNRQSYTPLLPIGTASVTVDGATPRQWQDLAALTSRVIPAAAVEQVRGVPFSLPEAPDQWLEVNLRAPGRVALLDGYSSAFGTSVLVGEALPSTIVGLSASEVSSAEAMLAKGGAVVFTSAPVDADTVRIRAAAYDDQGQAVPGPPATRLPAVFVQVGAGEASAQAVLSPAAARAAELPVATVGLLASGATITSTQESDLTEAVSGAMPNAYTYVERGYISGDDTVILLLVLGGLGGVLMLGGTLTATFLALSDARPDLATLSAVGASPRSRRGVAAAYALVVGGVGAVLGALIGFVPGIAVTYPLTSNQWSGEAAAGPSHYLVVPWLLIGVLVVALPLLTALIVGVCARSRLPLVARLG